MKISIVSFQKHRNVELEAAEQEYIKRLSLHAKVEVHALKNWDETAGLPEKFLKGTRIVGLFIDGKMSTSEQLAGQLQQWMNAGTSHIVLVIGAAEGMPAAVAGSLAIASISRAIDAAKSSGEARPSRVCTPSRGRKMV